MTFHRPCYPFPLPQSCPGTLFSSRSLTGQGRRLLNFARARQQLMLESLCDKHERARINFIR